MPNYMGTRTDYYADSISLSINYALDENDSLKSVMKAEFAANEPFITQNYLDQVLENEQANQEYLRYWHGYLIFVRPLMTIMNLEQMYLLNLVLLCGLIALIVARLFKRREYVVGFAFLVSMIATWAFFAPIALEFTWMFIVMLIVANVAMSLVWRDKMRYLPVLFLLTGMWAAFLDFLTTETITLTVPLLLVVWLGRKSWKGREARNLVMGSVAIWFIAFVLTWVAKWAIAGIVLGENVWGFVGGHIVERTIDDPFFNNPVLLAVAALFRNISNLMPFCLGVPGGLLAVFLAVTSFVLLKDFRKKKYHKELVSIMLLISLIPIVRFIVMMNHSYWHFFFTFRALCAPMMAAILILYEVVDFKKFKKEIARIKK